MFRKPLRIFFSGIGGSGMSAIASFMADKGHVIAGSDRAFDRNNGHSVYQLLRSKGITIVPQDGNGLNGSFDFAVFSTAVEPDRPEAIKAKELGIATKTRPEYLAEIVKEFKTIAISGTSGKSTTSGMISFAMERLGLQPNFIGGGRVKQFRTATNLGNAITGDSDYLVIEACESDGTIVDYKPLHSAILNLHLDHHSIDETAEMFETLIRNTKGMVVLNADDQNLTRLTAKGAITFSIENPSDYRATSVVYHSFSSDFTILGTRCCLSMPGKYNLYNALACIATLCAMGVSLEKLAGVLSEFRGIERRFDILLDDGKRLVIDDYAHNPHKISSLMEGIKNTRDRVCYIFQPHGFTPTRLMKKEYIEAFTRNLRDGDHLVLLPILYAGGTARKDISSHDLAEGIRAGRRSVEVVDGREKILERADEWDTFVVFGARDETLSDFAHDIVRVIQGTCSTADRGADAQSNPCVR
ncbi:MAG: Mur ligase family protein [Thermodesulfovibrionales bacterium]|jgi:UDP-N-acetylmuramate--alanine ligase